MKIRLILAPPLSLSLLHLLFEHRSCYLISIILYFIALGWTLLKLVYLIQERLSISLEILRMFNCQQLVFQMLIFKVCLIVTFYSGCYIYM